MTRDEALAILVKHRAELMQRGVLHAALFGSTARGEATADSDVDILVDLDPAASMGVWGFVDLQQFVGALFPRRVDVVLGRSLKPALRRNVDRDIVHAF